MTEENKILPVLNGEFGTIRLITEKGKCFFCGSDVAKALGYAIPTKAVNTHCKGVSKMETPTSGGRQQLLFITEGDVYRLVAHSKLPNAEHFESWVFDVVLPQIRQTGGYIPINPNQTEEEQKETAYSILKKAIALQEEIVHSTQPKVKAFDDLMESQGYLQMIDVASMLHIGRTKLFKFLRDNHILTKQSGFNIPYGRYLHSDYFKTVASVKNGQPITVTIVSPTGLEFIRNLLVKNNMIANEQEVA